MNGLVCDRCGKSLLVDEPVRYEMDLRIAAAYDPLEIAASDLAGDLPARIAALAASAARLPQRELEEDVFAERRYDLCPPCRRAVLERPFGGGV